MPATDQEDSKLASWEGWVSAQTYSSHPDLAGVILLFLWLETPLLTDTGMRGSTTIDLRSAWWKLNTLTHTWGKPRDPKAELLWMSLTQIKSY